MLGSRTKAGREGDRDKCEYKKNKNYTGLSCILTVSVLIFWLWYCTTVFQDVNIGETGNGM